MNAFEREISKGQRSIPKDFFVLIPFHIFGCHMLALKYDNL